MSGPARPAASAISRAASPASERRGARDGDGNDAPVAPARAVRCEVIGLPSSSHPLDDVVRTVASTDQTGSAMASRRRVLVWYWGRRGGGSQYTREIMRGLGRDGRFGVYGSLSTLNQQIDSFRGLADEICLVETYAGVAEFVLRAHRAVIACRRLRAFLLAHRIDIVISTMPHLWTVPALWYLRGTGVRIVSVIHDAASHPGFNTAPLIVFRPPLRCTKLSCRKESR